MLREIVEARAILDYTKFKDFLGNSIDEIVDLGSSLIVKKNGEKCEVWGNDTKLKFILDKRTMKDKSILDKVKQAMKASITYEKDSMPGTRILNRR